MATYQLLLTGINQIYFYYRKFENLQPFDWIWSLHFFLRKIHVTDCNYSHRHVIILYFVVNFRWLYHSKIYYRDRELRSPTTVLYFGRCRHRRRVCHRLVYFGVGLAKYVFIHTWQRGKRGGAHRRSDDSSFTRTTTTHTHTHTHNYTKTSYLTTYCNDYQPLCDNDLLLLFYIIVTHAHTHTHAHT
jgi:hypothetical protein